MSLSSSSAARLLPRLALLTLVLLYIVVLAGSIVRATGSGMGCPDWPRCFGKLIPPTSVSELPPDYKTLFKVEGKEIADFNVVHTWTEYINRLCGASSGFAMLLTAVASLMVWHRDRVLPFILFGALVLFGFVAWMGKVVVATNLAPYNITIHLAGALVLVAAALAALVRADRSSGAVQVFLPAASRRVLVATLTVAVLQILLGTQVREQVDEIGKSMGDCCPERIVPQLGTLLLVHKLSAWVVVGFVVWAWLLLRKSLDATTPRRFRRLVAALPLILVGEYLAGAVLVEFALPPVVQPVHMFLAAVLFGVLTALLLRTSRRLPESDMGQD